MIISIAIDIVVWIDMWLLLLMMMVLMIIMILLQNGLCHCTAVRIATAAPNSTIVHVAMMRAQQKFNLLILIITNNDRLL